jgi:probable F420-dependent oxidoreductase
MIPIGAVYPHNEIEPDVGAVRAYAQGVEAMGYSYVLAYDHVLGANTANRPDWKGLYKLETLFHEPLVMFAYMAGATAKLGFMTGVLVLPQRQAVLVAKQASTLDILCEGRLRIGVGTGWNEVEYEALGYSFEGRGERLEEQVELMRQLWTEPAVTFNGKEHSVSDAGINPMPIQRPIPVWMGGGGDRPHWGSKASTKVIRRIARMADGWIPMWDLDREHKDRIWIPGDRARELLAMCHEFCREYGRDPATLGLEGRLECWKRDEDRWKESVDAWIALGASHASVNTMAQGLQGVEQHLKRLEEYRAAWA